MSDNPPISLVPPEIVESMRQYFGPSYSDLAPLLLWKNDGSFFGLCNTGASISNLEYMLLSERLKMSTEIDHWLDVLKNPGDGTNRLLSHSRALGELKKQGHPDANIILSRTLRMHMLLKELVLVQAQGGRDDWTTLPGIAAGLHYKVPELSKALKDLEKARIPLSGDGPWYTSALLLLIAAVGESQCEYFRPVLWEAYSAGRARDELKSKWPTLNNLALNFISFLIRFQSAPGQWARGTGNAQFMDKARELGSPKEPINEATFLAAIRIVGVLEEARNHRLPVSPEQDDLVNYRIDREWGASTEETAKAIFANSNHGSNDMTWGYFRLLGLQEKELEIFKEQVMKANEEEMSEANNKSALPLVGYSVGRWQIENLKDAFSKHAKEVIEGKAMFTQKFHLRRVLIPSCFVDSNHDCVVEVLLNDYIAAETLFFDHP